MARAAVAATVLHPVHPRFLLVRRAREPLAGRWSLPGGKLEHGEPLLRGALRELKGWLR